jgi:hypothetical protein
LFAEAVISKAAHRRAITTKVANCWFRVREIQIRPLGSETGQYLPIYLSIYKVTNKAGTMSKAEPCTQKDRSFTEVL